MKKIFLILSSILSLTILSGCGVSQGQYDSLKSSLDSLQKEYDSVIAENQELQNSLDSLQTEFDLYKEKMQPYENLEIGKTEESETGELMPEQKDNEPSTAYNDMSNGPSELELMSYAQTVLDHNLPSCKYSRNKADYNFVKTNLRYKIEGEVTASDDASPENFYMIIQFVDQTYEAYDLISLQVGDEILYKASSQLSIPDPSSNNDILNEKNTKIYNEVMEQLYEDYDREEDDILEEIAPKYGMNGTELKEFMHDYMEAYYQ